jgi:hypothetical protein
MTSPQIVFRPEEFSDLFDHLANYPSDYKNMHTRAIRHKTILENGEKVQERLLRYLHIVHQKSENVIEGAISGKGISVLYEITRGRKAVPVTFIELSINDKEMKRLQTQFKKELFDRVRLEQTERKQFHRRKGIEGQYYVKRWKQGSLITDANCQQALISGELSRSFLEKLEPWKFQLMCP